MSHHGVIVRHPSTTRVRAPVEVVGQKQRGPEPYVLRPEECSLEAHSQAHQSRGLLRYAVWALFGIAGVYLLSTASLAVLGVAALAFVAVLGLLVAVALYAVNNTLI